MKNRWQEIWNNRDSKLNEIDKNDTEKIVLELKRIVGYDFFGKKSDITFNAFKNEYEYLKENLKISTGGEVFELGCGSGANLYFFKQDDFKIGGADYSENLLKVAKEVISEENFIECVCCEASEIPIDVKYDAVFSGDVFNYFSNLNYAEKVLNKMLLKTKKSIGLLTLLDENKKDEYFKLRRENIKNYDKLYKDLPKLFFTKEFFKDYAAKNNLEIKFDKNHMEGYWNGEFSFDCFMYRK